ncbi:hypothetical protein JTE90_001282 [Oedothorax gibbosus]|uniref:Uncharacterized protein n=1 Tax=Oedothorax gibbosus TaxID=931172 RepID=A0AAV6V3X5_9ARAC|nr:hypothetical protein JTE90_001282 [Oedothorax gibbosus]
MKGYLPHLARALQFCSCPRFCKHYVCCWSRLQCWDVGDMPGRFFGLLATFAALAVIASGDGLRRTDRSISAHLLHLGQCRRQFTFLASAALGVFLTRVLKESPLTPLPLPPLESSLRWNLVTVPAHLAGPFYNWITRHPAGQTVHLNQGFGGLVEAGGLFRSENKISSTHSHWKNNIISQAIHMRYSRDSVANAFQRTLKPLKFILPHAMGIRRWLLRLCG